MKHLYSYIIEKQGYLDYSSFIDDILNQFSQNENFIKKIWEYIVNKSESIEFNILVESDNYPYWLEKLYIDAYPLDDYTLAGISPDLIVLNKDKTKVKSATLIINESYFDDTINEITNLMYKLHGNDYKSDLTRDDINQLKAIKILDIKSIDKTVISHEIKHIFDFLIGNSKQDKGLLRSFDGNSYLNISSDNHEISSSYFLESISELLYFFDLTEESAFQQQLIEYIRLNKISKEEIENFLHKINKSTASKFDFESSDLEYYHGSLKKFIGICMLISASYCSLQELSRETISELCTIIKQYEVSEIVLHKKFNGSTYKDLKIFYLKCYDAFKQHIVKMVKKAAKHL